MIQPARIRPYRPQDLDALYRVCLETADNGADATSLYDDPRMPGYLWAAPYAVFEPSLAFVAEDGAGVGGYIVGALDTEEFDRCLDRDWWPGLRARYPEPPSDVPQEQWTRDQREAYLIHHPWPRAGPHAVRYPSHFHINLVPRLQHRGLGKELIRTLVEALRTRGSRGVHLHANLGNPTAAEFYRHLGFDELPSADSHAFGMEIR